MKRIALLLANGFEAVEASVFTDVLGWNQTDGDGTTELVTVGLHDTLQCTFNFTVIPEMHLCDCKVEDFDALAIPGGFEEAGFYEDAYHEDFLSIIRDFDKAGKLIASICVAALPIGKSGILTGRTGTTYHSIIRQTQLAEYGVQVLADQPIVVDHNVITSYNPSTAFEVAFTLLEMLTTRENSNHIRKLMGFQEK